MSDQNKFVNLYIDNALGMASDYMKQVVQLKTQLDISNDLVHQKDEVISSLQSDSEKNKTDNDQLHKAQEDVKILEAECVSLRSKATHMDTLTNQFNQMKNDLIVRTNDLNNMRNQSAAKDNEINNLNSSISNHKATIDDLTKQIQAKDVEIVALKDKLEASVKKVINTKVKPKSIPKDKIESTNGDDF